MTLDAKTLGILGTALSALIAALGYYARSRHERLRTTRTVLYHLLEMRHQLAAVQYMTGRFLPDYLSVCKEVLASKGIQISSSEYEEIERGGREHFRAFAAAQLERLRDEVFKPYQATLEVLAKDDPILAFRLKGKESFVAPAEASQLFSFASETQPGTIENSVKNGLISDLQDIVRESTLEDINDATAMVALECGLLTYIQVRVLLWHASRVKLPPSFAKSVDATLSKIIHHAVSIESEASTSDERSPVECAQQGAP